MLNYVVLATTLRWERVSSLRMRKGLRILTRFVLILLVVIISLWVLVQLPPVQTALVGMLTKRISEATGFDVQIGRVDVRYPLEMLLYDVRVIDDRADTLLYSEGVFLRALDADLDNNRFHIGRVELLEPFFQITFFEGDSLTNLDRLLANIPESTDTLSSSQPVIITGDDVRIRNGRFIYSDRSVPDWESDADFDHIEVRDFFADISSVKVVDGDIDAMIEELRFRESCGFVLQELNGAFKMRSDTLQLDRYLLQTPGTLLKGDLQFTFEEWRDFSAFTEKVTMRGVLEDSHVDFADLALFAPELRYINRQVAVAGRFRGPVANLKVRDLALGYEEATRLYGRIDLTGLPDIDRTFIDLTINKFTTVKRELDGIPIPPFESLKTLKTPANLATLGEIGFNGKFTGFFNDFVAFGTLTTAIGTINTDIKLQELPNDYAYSGELQTLGFDLGKFYKTPELGRLTSTLRLQGTGLTRTDLDASIEGYIASLTARGYTYRDIETTGEFKRDFFNGVLSISDDNIDLDFNGLIDFTKDVPRFDFMTSITHLNPIALNLVDLRDYTSVSGDFRIEATGLTFNEVNGRIIGDSVRFCTSNAEYPIEHLELIMEQSTTVGKRFVLDSDIASGRLEGKFDFAGLESGVRHIIADIVPHIEPPAKEKRGREDFYLEINVHNFEAVSEVFLPELFLAPKSRLALLMDDATGDFKTTFTTDRIAYEGYSLDTLLLDVSHPDQSLYVTLQAAQANFGSGIVVPVLVVDAYNERDTVYTNLSWGRNSDVLRGDLALVSNIRGNRNVSNALNGFNVYFNDERWSIQNQANIDVDSTRIAVDGFFLSKGNEFVKIDGAVSELPEERLRVDLQGFQLSNFNALLENQGIEQYGMLTGDFEIRDVYNASLITCDVLALDYTVNGYLIGDICTESSWDPILKRLLLAGDIDRQKLRQLTFSGFYTPSDDESPLDLTIGLKDLPLNLANAFLDESYAEIAGTADGRIEVTGKPSNPIMNGQVKLNKASVRIDYLNTTYFIDDVVDVGEDMFSFDFNIADEDGNSGFAVGAVIHDQFDDWNFDLFLDIEKTPFLLMNTTAEMNSLYFGKAYASGFVNVGGTLDDLVIDVTAKSERGTSIALPLDGAEDVTFEDFISFVDADAPASDEKEIDLSGIRMNFELDITPDAQFRIIFDEVVGDEISGRGSGAIRMVINNLNTFNMYGTVEVDQGRYLFTLKNLINKEFEVKPGGTITWFGDPLAADINLDAIYKVNTSLYDLFPEESEQLRQRIPVHLNMLLTGKLMSPLIGFDISLPTSDDLTRARLAGTLNNEQEVNRQAFSLLVLRRFISPPDIAKTNSSLGLAENSTELITSQLSNWLSQISDDFDIGVNYSPGDQISNDELAIALSTQLFNDRLLLSGNFGVQQAPTAAGTENSSNLIGDIRIEYKVTPKGKIRLIVYNQSNEFDLVRNRQNNYTQGMGIVYQEEFNSLYELFKLDENP